MDDMDDMDDINTAPIAPIDNIDLYSTVHLVKDTFYKLNGVELPDIEKEFTLHHDIYYYVILGYCSDIDILRWRGISPWNFREYHNRLPSLCINPKSYIHSIWDNDINLFMDLDRLFPYKVSVEPTNPFSVRTIGDVNPREPRNQRPRTWRSKPTLKTYHDGDRSDLLSKSTHQTLLSLTLSEDVQRDKRSILGYNVLPLVSIGTPVINSTSAISHPKPEVSGSFHIISKGASFEKRTDATENSRSESTTQDIEQMRGVEEIDQMKWDERSQPLDIPLNPRRKDPNVHTLSFRNGSFPIGQGDTSTLRKCVIERDPSQYRSTDFMKTPTFHKSTIGENPSQYQPTGFVNAVVAERDPSQHQPMRSVETVEAVEPLEVTDSNLHECKKVTEILNCEEWCVDKPAPKETESGDFECNVSHKNHLETKDRNFVSSFLHNHQGGSYDCTRNCPQERIQNHNDSLRHIEDIFNVSKDHTGHTNPKIPQKREKFKGGSFCQQFIPTHFGSSKNVSSTKASRSEEYPRLSLSGSSDNVLSMRTQASIPKVSHEIEKVGSMISITPKGTKHFTPLFWRYLIDMSIDNGRHKFIDIILSKKRILSRCTISQSMSISYLRLACWFPKYSHYIRDIVNVKETSRFFRQQIMSTYVKSYPNDPFENLCQHLPDMIKIEFLSIVSDNIGHGMSWRPM